MTASGDCNENLTEKIFSAALPSVSITAGLVRFCDARRDEHIA